ncbi:MAG: DUF4145 domain-containing protein [Sphingomonas sp.]
MVGGAYSGEKVTLHSEISVCPKCHGSTIDLEFYHGANRVYQARAYPRSGPFPPAPAEVPPEVSNDYIEANEVLPISPKASAALARRCLQSILTSRGYTGRDLVKQVEAALAETNASKALPASIKENMDAIRNFGNFSAHPITDMTTLQVVEVEDGEAEWCLEILLDMFQHYYVAPAKAAERRAALAEKLTAAGKPAMKG